jgi:hypothetical protein
MAGMSHAATPVPVAAVSVLLAASRRLMPVPDWPASQASVHVQPIRPQAESESERVRTRPYVFARPERWKKTVMLGQRASATSATVP